MGFCVRRKVKRRRYVSRKTGLESVREYAYYELVRTYRDPSDRKKVLSEFCCHLGKHKSRIQARLERFKQQAQGRYDMDSLVRKIAQKLRKDESCK